MSTFPLFTCLPYELRARIWELSVEPRTVEVRVNYEEKFLPASAKENTRKQSIRQVFSPTPVPAVLQVCRESRNQGLYQQEYFDDTSSHPYVGEPRHVWLNLEIDMVSIDELGFCDIITIATRLKRLKFARKNSYEGFHFYHYEVRELHDFPNLQEVHVVCLDGLHAWWGAAEDHYWPCGEENLFFIDPDNGQMIRSIEMDIQFDEEMKVRWAADGYVYPTGEPIGEAQTL